MKDLRKILLLDMPAPLLAALAEQLPEDGFAVHTAPDAAPFDLIITGGAAPDVPGCPVLRLVSGTRVRLGAVLRQAAAMLAEPGLHLPDIAFGDWVLKPAARALQSKDGDIALTDREADMLAYLARAGLRGAGRDELLRNVWRYQDGVDTHTLETHIYRLRQKTGQDIIVTDAGGYRLCAPPRALNTGEQS